MKEKHFDFTESLAPIFIEYISGARELLETESEKDSAVIIKDIKIHFIGFIKELVSSFPLDKRRTLIRKELRRLLFNLFASWAGRYVIVIKKRFNLNSIGINSKLPIY